MSGKEPPKGPRALRVPGGFGGPGAPGPSHPHGQPAASSSRLPSSSISVGMGAAPPTGPRSLVNSLTGSRGQPPSGPLAAPKGYMNGFLSRVPPAGPKGKGLASVSPPYAPTLPAALASQWPNGRPPPTGPSALNRLTNGASSSGTGRSTNGSASPTMPTRSPISFSLPNANASASSPANPPPPKQPPPPPPPDLPPLLNTQPSELPRSPDSSPPPPPPPTTPPHLFNGDPPPSPPSTPPPPAGPPPLRSPPPPPPAEVPNDRSPISIKLPAVTPQEPKLAPPPLPPAPPPESKMPRIDPDRGRGRGRGRGREREREREEHLEPRSPSHTPPPLPPPDPRLKATLPRRPTSYTTPRSPSPARREPSNHAHQHTQTSRCSPPPLRPPTPIPEGVSVTYKPLPGHQRPQKLYSLNPPPPMPPRSVYTPMGHHDYRLLYDSACDKDRYGEMKLLIDMVRAAGKEDRIKNGGKLLVRLDGETIKGEKEAKPSDPRKEAGFKVGKPRTDMHITLYEHDSNTPGPPPPTNILVFGFSELTPTAKVRQHFQKYGSILSFERELDRVTGGQMGVASIAFATHEEAKKAVEGEEGKNFTLAAIGGGLPTVSFARGTSGAEKDSVKVLFDGEGKLLKLVLSLYDEKRRRDKSGGATASGNATTSTPNGQTPLGQKPSGFLPPRTPFAHPLPQHSGQRPPLPHGPQPHSHPNYSRPPPRTGPLHLPRGPGFQHPNSRYGMSAGGLASDGQSDPGLQNHNAMRKQPPPSLVRARAMNAAKSTVHHNIPALNNAHHVGGGLRTPTNQTDSSRPVTPVHLHHLRGRGRGLLPGHVHSHPHTPTHTSASTPRGSRSPSPAQRVSESNKKREETRAERETKHRSVVQALVKNGFDYARIDEAQLSGGAAREEDVKEFFKGFPVDEVLHDHLGWYITFRKPDAASRAARVLAIGTHTLANRSVTVSMQTAAKTSDIKPSSFSPASFEKNLANEKHTWKPQELVEEAGKVVLAELRALLEKDVMERIVSMQIRKMIAERRRDKEGGSGEVHSDLADEGRIDKSDTVDFDRDRDRERQRLKGLSFKKRKQKTDNAASKLSRDEGRDREDEHEVEDVSRVVTRVDEEGPLVAVTLAENDRERIRDHEERESELRKGGGDRIESTVLKPEKEGRPRKRRRKTAARVVRGAESEREVESEDDDVDNATSAKVVIVPPAAAPDTVSVIVEDVPSKSAPVLEPEAAEPTQPVNIVPPVQRKRSPSPTPVDEPPAKRSKVIEGEHVDNDKPVDAEPPSPVVPSVEQALVPAPASVKSSKKSTKKAVERTERAEKVEKKKPTGKRSKKAKADRAVLETLVIPPQMEADAPSVAEVRVSPSPASAWVTSAPTPEPPLSMVPEKIQPSPKRHPPLPEYSLRELVGDDEDLYFAKLALSLDVDSPSFKVQEETTPPSDPNAPPPFRKHVTGSARSEGYYKISHAEKSAYVAQYALRGAGNGVPAEKESVTPQEPIVSSRSNRANARRRAQGLEEMNQLQLAVALSKGESAATEVMKFNQLQTRKKHLRFARSPIHDWGLYAMERISRGEMVIEYVGEIIRAAVADKREKAYERQGIGSSYLFRIDEDLVVDATKKGNLGRLINHSCDPNCTAKIITINGEKKIVIYAKQDIELGDEITYDYHFPIEQDKIPCLCGSAKCRGFLN